MLQKNLNLNFVKKQKGRVLSWLFLLAFIFSNNYANSQIVINEILPGGDLELKNIGSTPVDISGYFLCEFPVYTQLSNLTAVCGSTTLAPGELFAIEGFNNLDGADGELGLYSASGFGNPDNLIDYVEWGSAGHQRSGVAITAGIWTAGSAVDDFTGASISYDGVGNAVTDWTVTATTTICAENVLNTTNGGTITGGPFEFCVDGMADNVSGITLTGNTGTNSQWVITDDQGNILGLPPMPGVVDFDGAGAGVCLIYHLSHEDDIMGLAAGENIGNFSGTFSLSNSISVTRNQPEGGTLTGGPFAFEVGDGVADMIPAGAISLTNNTGGNAQWLVTDADGTILGLPPMPSVVDFDGAGPGTCLVWHLSYEDGIEGLAAGANANDLSGCFSLSNPISVERTDVSGTDGIDLALDITVDNSSYERYEEVAYTITVTNDGSEMATDVVVSAGLPSGLVYTDDQVSQGNYNLFFEEWNVGNLAAGASAELELTLFTLVEGVDVVNFVQVISAGGNDADSTPDNNDTNIPQEDDEAAVTISEFGGTGAGDIDLELSLIADRNTYDIYENVTYTISVTNNGTDDATNIIIAAGLPDGMVYTGHAESAGDYNLFFETWSIPMLEAGETAELELVLFTLVENQPIVQFVEVLAANESDDDSTPGNGNGVNAQEDDEADFTISFGNALVANAATRSEIRTIVKEQTLFPNPAVELLNLTFNTEVETALSIRVFNITGQIQMDIPVNTYRGLNQFTLDVSSLTNGTYFVEMVGATVNEQPIQFVKIK